jgi:hypothetical protein
LSAILHPCDEDLDNSDARDALAEQAKHYFQSPVIRLIWSIFPRSLQEDDNSK